MKKCISCFLIIFMMMNMLICTAAESSSTNITVSGTLLGLENDYNATITLKSEDGTLKHIDMVKAGYDGSVLYYFKHTYAEEDAVLGITCGNVLFSQKVSLAAEVQVDVSCLSRFTINDRKISVYGMAQEDTSLYLLKQCDAKGAFFQDDIIDSVEIHAGNTYQHTFDTSMIYPGETCTLLISNNMGYYAIREIDLSKDMVYKKPVSNVESERQICVYGFLAGMSNDLNTTVYIRNSNGFSHLDLCKLDDNKNINYTFTPESGLESGRLFLKNNDSIFYKDIIPNSTRYVNTSLISRIEISGGTVTVSGQLVGDNRSDTVYAALVKNVGCDMEYQTKDIICYQEVMPDESYIYSAVLTSDVTKNCTLVVKTADSALAVFNVDPSIQNVVDFFTTEKSTRERFEAATQNVADEQEIKQPVEFKGMTEIYVSCTGNDDGPGTFEQPFKTLKKAISYAQALSQLKKDNGVGIFLRGGIYYAEKEIELNNYYTDSDTPLYISAYENEKVVINSAKVLATEDFESAEGDPVLQKINDESARDKILKYDLTALRIDASKFDIDKINLFQNGERLTLARYPNYEEVELTKVTDPGVATDETEDDGNGFTFDVEDERPATWNNTGQLRMFGAFCVEWYKQSVGIRDINGNSIRTYDATLYGAKKSTTSVPNMYYYYNIFEELDAPGEWYIDQTENILYLYPNKQFQQSEVYLSCSNINLLSVRNSSGIVVNGIEFICGRAGVAFQNVQNSIIQNCVVKHMTNYGISLQSAENCFVLCNQVEDIGYYAKSGERSGIYVACLYAQRFEHMSTLDADNNFIQNNVISNMFLDTDGIRVIYQKGDIISHNLVMNTPSHGIWFSQSYGCFIEYNEVCGGPNVFYDAGGIYTGGAASAAGNHIRYNYIHDFNKEHTKISRGIYLDEVGSYEFIYGNVIENIPNGIFMHSGHDNAVVDNIVMLDVRSTGYVVADSVNHYAYTSRYWDKQLLEDGSGVDILLPRFADDSYMYQYPEIFSFVSKVAVLKKLKSDPEYSRGDLENSLKAPFGQYIADNVVVGEHEIVVTELGSQTVEGLETNHSMTLEEYTSFEKAAERKNRAGLTDASLASDSCNLKISGIYQNDTETVVSWNKILQANYYQINVSLTNDFSEILVSGETINPYYSFYCSSDAYYIKVTAKSYASVFNDDELCSIIYKVEPEIRLNIENTSFSEGTVSFEVANPLDFSVNYTLILAKYQHEILSNCKILKDEKINGNETKPYQMSFPINQEEELRIFLWNGITEIKALAKCVSMKGSE